jgi:hypothetical protein
VNRCSALIGDLTIKVGDPYWRVVFDDLARSLTDVEDEAVLAGVLSRLRGVEASGMAPAARYAAMREIVDASRPAAAPPTLGAVIAEKRDLVARAQAALLASDVVGGAVERAVHEARREFRAGVAAVVGTDVTTLAASGTRLHWLRQPMAARATPASVASASRERVDSSYAPAAYGASWPIGHDGHDHVAITRSGNGGGRGSDGQRGNGGRDIRVTLDARTTFEVASGPRYEYVPTPAYRFCIPPNPVLQTLRLRAELNLFKIRSCRNIAGMERELEPFAAPTDTVSGLPLIGAGGQLVLPGAMVFRPTPYRYVVLIERAKQLTGIAQQIEAAFLATLEKRDAEYYHLLKAKQDVRLSRATVRLQDLRVREAEGGVKLAELQQNRAALQVDHYKQLIEEPNWDETRALALMKNAADLQFAAALVNFGTAAAHGIAAYLAWPDKAQTASQVAAGLSSTAGGLSSLAGEASTRASHHSTVASYARRLEEWQFQRALSAEDVRIAGQQMKIAEDHVRVVGQERVIADMQSEHAEAIADFLGTKFTGVELYDWMSGVLEGVYAYFLQHATAMAHLAANQLAFERQTVPPSYLQNDYWVTPDEYATTAGTDGRAPDRRGLTGSARLLQDIWQLDQYAFETNKRKLQLTKTISLARMAPGEFQRFRETGVMPFATPMHLFDRDFPGHLLRLIRRVRTSVIALTPPTQGIRATLSSLGNSRVVIRGGAFQTVLVRHDPQSVALSSPREATGLFELEQQSEMLFPFESLGVDTAWELRLPKPANPFDYRTIADVLFTIEYTAVDDPDYRQQVIQQLDRRADGDRAFSFRHELPDQWYELHNPEENATTTAVRFRVDRDDFPPNVDQIKLAHVALYFSRADSESFEVPITHLRLTAASGAGAVGGGAATNDGIASTRRGNAGAWTTMIGKAPFGDWELALPTQDVRDYFEEDRINDLLLVLSYSGEAPAWPA